MHPVVKSADSKAEIFFTAQEDEEQTTTKRVASKI